MLRQLFMFFSIGCLVSLGTGNFVLAASSDMPDMEETVTAEEGMRSLGELHWYTDYAEAYSHARRTHSKLLIVFQEELSNRHETFEREVLASDELMNGLLDYVRVVVPTSETTPDEEGLLLEHSSFKHMQRMPGVAILDLSNPDAETFGHLVSAFPFSSGRSYTKSEMQTILGLPEGTITQRTLVYALRRHPGRPRSAYGAAHPYLMQQAHSHSGTMARTRSVGHHNWGYRFGQISRAVGPAREVAVAGRGYTLVDAANDCIRTWRSSPSHWNMMIRNARYMGYDMVQAGNGMWYATGIMVQ